MPQPESLAVAQVDLEVAADASRAAADIVLRYIDADPAVSSADAHAALRTISDYNRLHNQLHPKGRGLRTILEI